MDKYEYKLRTDQMLELMEKGAYDRAADIANSIDWKRVRNTNMLINVSNIYEKIGDYHKSYDVLKTAYQRGEGSRKILMHLCTLAMKTGNLDEAIDYYDEFVQIAPKDPNRYILKYRLLRARRAPIEQQIHALEEFKKSEYIEEWAYELAKRYQEAGMTAECLEECDDLILWFSEGKYVYKAMELKMQYKPLTPSQQEKYDRRFEKDKPADDSIDFSNIKIQTKEEKEKTPEETEAETEQALQEAEEAGQKAEAKRKLGNTMKLGEALKNLLHPEQSDAEEPEEEAEEEIDLSELEEEDLSEPEEEELAESEEDLSELEEEDLSDLEEEMAAIEEIADLNLADTLAEEHRQEEKKEEKAEETKEEDTEAPEEAEVSEEDLSESEEGAGEAESEETLEPVDIPEDDAQEEETDVQEPEEDGEAESVEMEEMEKVVDDIGIDDILAEWDALEDGVSEVKEEPEVDVEEAAEDLYNPQTPILSPEIQRMIDEIEGMIPEEEEKKQPEEPVRTPVKAEEPVENKEETTQQLRIDEDELLLEDAEDIPYEDEDEELEDYLSEDDAEELEDEFEEEMEDDYDSIAEGLRREFSPVTDMAEDDREIPDEDEPEDILSATTPLSRKETAKLIATGKTAPLPMDEIANALSISETGFLVHSRYDFSGQGAKRDLTEEQKKLFSYFVPVRGMSEQLLDVLEQDRNCTNRKGTSCTGNLLIIGNKGNGKTVLAVDVVKAIQKQRKIRQGRVAIITGEALNKKKISDIVAKLYGGALIIEKAGKLNERTVARLNKAMEKDTGEMLIVLEEQRKPLDRLLSSNREFRKKFTSRLEVPIFVNDELVTFGQTYAQENGYRIDEMGILALYSRIDAMQREDHAVTIAEVKEVMDEAMAHSQKASAKKLVKRVLGKNTDDADRILLTERDFNI